MKDLLKKPLTFEKVEFWAATFIYFCLILALGYNVLVLISSGSLDAPNMHDFIRTDQHYSYIANYFLPELLTFTTFYGFFLLLNFYLIKPIASGHSILLNIMLTLIASAVFVFVLGLISTWYKAYMFSVLSEKYAYRRIFKAQFVIATWATLAILLYNISKYSFLYFYKNFYQTAVLNKLQRECAAALGIWFLSVVFLLITSMRWHIVVVWGEMGLFSIGLYWFSCQNLIPWVLEEGQPFRAYLIKVGIIWALSFFPVAILVYLFLHNVEGALIVNLFNAGLAVFFVAPLTWYIYRSRMQQIAELTGLKTALNQSSANVDLLRSQINPHFLFNALNTLYGTALQENADRTGEGIQRLGDMMRFMLQENVQEQISLMREVDYLNNYIALQKLRTQTSADITIQTEIEEQVNGLQIAPMLLIPFVENAFKHGISLRNPSHIKVTLNTKGSELFFDVYNSTHIKPDNDPEQNKSGIGLENVKQRLQLVYPGKHELVIRESAKEFFVHLTLNLN